MLKHRERHMAGYAPATLCLKKVKVENMGFIDLSGKEIGRLKVIKREETISTETRGGFVNVSAEIRAL